MSRVQLALLASAIASAAITAVAAAVAGLHFAYRGPAVHVALETTAALVALFAAFLVAGRVRREGRPDELLLVGGLSLLALSSLVFAAVPAILERPSDDRAVWALVISGTVGTSLFGASAFVGAGRLARARAGLLLTGTAVVLTVLASGLAAWLLDGRLPAAVRVVAAPSGRPQLDANAAVLVIQLLAAAAYAAAAVGFVRRHARTGDELLAWLALAAVLAAYSRVNYFLYPSRYSEWVYIGDAFRLAFFLTLLVGAGREITSYWRALAEAAVAEERRRIARELHDGLAQELALIRRNVRLLEGGDGGDADVRSRIEQAAERAELESRRAIATLAATGRGQLGVTLGRAVSEVADRLGAEVDLDVAPDVRLPASREQALVRIACEAVANAARHSGSRRVGVSLARFDGGVRLRVADQGTGFDEAAAGSGFGLASMRERARAAGAELRVSSAPGRGTVVEVEL